MDDSTALLAELDAMPAFLDGVATRFPGDAARERPGAGAFAFVEHVWHLADLEREGFAIRIRRLLAEKDPALPDFDGAALARKRDYRARDVGGGLAAFARARAENVAVLRGLGAAERARAGIQEGVGAITLGEIPGKMADHDRSHRVEIDELIRAVVR